MSPNGLFLARGMWQTGWVLLYEQRQYVKEWAARYADLDRKRKELDTRTNQRIHQVEHSCSDVGVYTPQVAPV